MSKERLDIYLMNNMNIPSRSKAAELIKNNKISVDGKVIDKASYLVDENNQIKILENEVLKFVSRGGLKLQKAIQYFNIDVKNKTILDIGASTGGFTDCALQNGAKKVFSLDVGTNQLHESLRNDNRVVCIENTNFKDVNASMFDPIDLFVCDVSFISIQTILRKMKETFTNFQIMILYKPQFEVGKNNLNKKGVVKNEKVLVKSLNEFNDFLNVLKIGIIDATYSPIIGQKKGNIEYLFYLSDSLKSKSIDFERLVKESYDALR